MAKFLRKVVILGTTGSGKTTFFKNLISAGNDFLGGEVQRKVKLEESILENTFTTIDKNIYQNSTTTISFNVKLMLFVVTKTNYFHYFPLTSNELPIDEEDIDAIYPTLIIDNAGQERFDFMTDISLDGADGVIIFSDGTNIQSVERISVYLDMVKKLEGKNNTEIPVLIFINKKDLEHKGIYVGMDSITRWIDSSEINIYETSNLDMESFILPLRIFLNQIHGFPLTLKQVKTASTRYH
ncbi:MAG: hypothetical protein OEZ01_07615 [Candidatus Heimdallarchaeota archaeon]|nr:hypothetical protein [Candidatus Heimdallarchaeota archaeon]MDH5645859.1 hypothetical protein [Candidatus Heimdallarchaeota archaeon]